jgi:magnesium transporter
MENWKRNLSRKVGKPSGTLVYTGKHEEITKVQQIVFDSEYFSKHEVNKISELQIDEKRINWIIVNGFSDLSLITQIAEKLEIHPLLLEDGLNVNHIPKIEKEKNQLSIVLKNFVNIKEKIVESHVLICISTNLIIIFNELTNPLIDEKTTRYELNQTRGRTQKVDYSLYSMLDSVIDSYFIAFENLREEISNLEEKIFTMNRENHIDEIYKQKNKLESLRKSIFPVRDIIRNILEDELEKISTKNLIYYRDLQNHIHEILGYYESFREILSGLINLNESNLNNETNRIIKSLTIVSTLFIPLTFIVGIYGMNFKFMPELEWKYGYYFILSLMAVISAFVVLFIKRKKWL